MCLVLKIMAPQDELESLSLRRIAARSRQPEPNIHRLQEAAGWFPLIRTLSIDYGNSKGGDSQPSHTSLGDGRLRSLTQLQSLRLRSATQLELKLEFEVEICKRK
jgi:hypothetical protein